jgi:hypothetical protein
MDDFLNNNRNYEEITFEVLCYKQERSRVQFPIRLLDFSVDLTLPVAL